MQEDQGHKCSSTTESDNDSYKEWKRKEKRMKAKERKHKHRRKKWHDSDQTDKDSAHSDRNHDIDHSRLAIKSTGIIILSQMNASLYITHSLTAMKYFDGSDPKVCRKWLKISINMSDVQDRTWSSSI